MGLKLANNATSRLAATLAAAGTTVTVMLGEGARFPALNPGDWFPATIVAEDYTFEIVKVTARGNDTLTVQRGQEDTLAREFPIGSRIELRITAQTFTMFLAEFLPLVGGNLTGDVSSSAAISALGLFVGEEAVWHAGNFDPDGKLGNDGNQVLEGEKLTIQNSLAPRLVFHANDGIRCIGVDGNGDLVIGNGSDFSDVILKIASTGKLWTKETELIGEFIISKATAKAEAAADAVKDEVLAEIASGYIQDIRLGAQVTQLQVGATPGLGFFMESWGYQIPNYPTGVWRPIQVKKGGSWVTVGGA